MRSIERIEEWMIGADRNEDIAQLLGICFPQYPAHRSFFHQIPAFRLLTYEEGALIGHVAVEHRIINVGGTELRIFGVADICVLPERQGEGMGTQLLQELEDFGRKCGIDYLLLLAYEQDWFLHRGFRPVNQEGRWLWIQKNETFGVIQRGLNHELMVKPLSHKRWRAGTVDFLGHIF